MKIIILAAGKGERLWPLTKDTPKPLVDVGGGVTLLDEQLDRLRECKVVDEVIIVTGYLGHKVDQKVAIIDIPGIAVRTIYNPFYRTSNNLASLWLAQHEMNDDFMVTNGDNLFNKGVFQDFSDACTKDGVFLSVGKKEAFDDDDMKVSLDAGVVTQVAKDIPRDLCNAESPGLCLVRGEKSRSNFKKAMRSELTSESGLQTFWLSVFEQLYKDGVPATPWFFDASCRWREVDIHPDVEQMKQFLNEMVHTKQSQ